MKLLFLTHDSSLNGGAQKCLFDLIKGIKTDFPTYHIYMIFAEEGDMIEKCSPYLNGYKVISRNWWLTYKGVRSKEKRKILKKILKDTREIISYCKVIKPDYGVTNTIVIPPLAIACKFLGIKHLWFIHEIPDAWENLQFIYNTKFIYRGINYLSYKVLVPSVYTKKYYQMNISLSKIQVVNQAVELKATSVIPDVTISEERYTVLQVGAFDSNKGQMELLQAIKQITDQDRDIHCYMIGDGSELLEDCKKYIKENHMERFVTITPFTNEIEYYYRHVDIVVVCSGLETFGRVAIEAQKCNLPVILSNVGANPERIQNGITGLLYQKGDITDLVEKIELLRDKKVRSDYQKNLESEDLEKYSIHSFAYEFQKILHS